MRNVILFIALAACGSNMPGDDEGPTNVDPKLIAGGGVSDGPNLPYLGQPVPGLTPQRFAPGIDSTDAIELNAVFSADAREFYFTHCRRAGYHAPDGAR